jgi:hypothetical protein
MHTANAETRNPQPWRWSITRRRFLGLITAAPLAAAGCKGGMTILGYNVGSDALYDPDIHTVYVPEFNNRAFQTNPYRGFEIDVTRAVIREIGKSTPFRVTSDCTRADTELLGNLVSISENILNINQLNFTREGEIVVTVDVVWRDLRSGKVLSNARQAPTPGRVSIPKRDTLPPPFDPNVQLPPEELTKEERVPTPTRIVATGRVIPELGESDATAAQAVQTKIAVQIVSMMEKRW